MLVDTHCHYDMCEDPIQVINESEHQKTITIGMTNLPSHFELGFPRIKHYKYVRLALGLHPLLAKSHKNEHDKFKKNLQKTTFIGEVGLDFSRDGNATKHMQIESFEFVLKSISGLHKLVSLHSRKAEKDVLEMLIKHDIKHAIFHWYTGGITVLRQILDAGYFFSINPSMIRSKSGKKLIAEIPLEKVLTETDCPYTSIGNKPTKPSDVRKVIYYLAEAHGLSPEKIENQVYSNFRNLIEELKS